MQLFQQSEATAAQRRWYFACVDATDGFTAEPGLTFTAGDLQVSKNGGAFANFAGTVTDLGDGMYYYEATAAELDTLGPIGFKVEETGVRLTLMTPGQVVPWDPYDVIRLGQTALPAAAAEAAGGLYTRGTGAGQINQPANGMVDTNTVRWLGTACATPTVAGVPETDTTHWSGAAVSASPAGIPSVNAISCDVTKWLGTACAAVTVAGVPEVDATYWRGGLIVAPTTTGTPNVTTVAMAADSITESTLTQGARARLQGVMHKGVIAAASASTVTLAAAGYPFSGAPSSTTNDTLKGCWIAIIDDELGGVTEVRLITAYNGTTRVATVAPNFRVTPPANGEKYEILPAAGIDIGMWLNTIPATPTTAGVPRVDVKALEANVLTAASTHSDYVTELQAGLATAAAVDTIDNFLDSEITDIKAKTDLIPADPADASDISAALALIQADTDNIQTRLPAALVSGKMDSSVSSLATDAISAASLSAAAITKIDTELTTQHGAGAWNASGAASAADVATAVWAKVIESGYSAAEIIRLLTAILAGNGVDLDGPTPSFLSLDGTKTRVTGVTDDDERTATIGDLDI